MKTPFHLRPEGISHDTIVCHETLTQQGKAGQLLGTALVAMYKGRSFVIEITGECYRNPLFTRALVAELDDELGRLCKHSP